MTVLSRYLDLPNKKMFLVWPHFIYIDKCGAILCVKDTTYGLWHVT